MHYAVIMHSECHLKKRHKYLKLKELSAVVVLFFSTSVQTLVVNADDTSQITPPPPKIETPPPPPTSTNTTATKPPSKSPPSQEKEEPATSASTPPPVEPAIAPTETATPPPSPPAPPTPLVQEQVTKTVPVSTDKQLKDEEGSQKLESTRSPIHGVSTIEPAEEILEYTSPIRTSRSQPEFFFIGRTKQDVSVFSFKVFGNKFYNHTILKQGYLGAPMGFDRIKQRLFLVLKSDDTDHRWWTHASEQWSGDPVQLAVLETIGEKWRFLKIEALTWIPEIQRFLVLNKADSHLYLSSLQPGEKKYFSPIQDTQRSPKILRAFALSFQRSPMVLWIDLCQKNETQQCLWMSPASTKDAFIPKLFSELPRTPEKKHRWLINQLGSVLVLTLWEEGVQWPTERWWTQVNTRKWIPLSRNRFSEPKANSVIHTASNKKVLIYYLSTDNGADTRLARASIVYHRKGSDPDLAQIEMKSVGLPFLSDLFSVNRTQMIAISQDAIRRLDIASIFSQ